MLSSVENEILSRTGPGTLMGDLLRRYWIPALPSSELPEPDCAPVRVRMLSEDLVAYRDTEGEVGLLAAACPHRGASLFFGRNEESGLRCVYHGWKFDTTGACVDMPSEPAESNFKTKVTARAYPAYESGGVVWTYMGPTDKKPAFRDFGTESLPREQWRANRQVVLCNWVQSMEGSIDSAHISYLHRNLADYHIEDDGTDQPGYPTVLMSNRIRGLDGAPQVEIEETPYGFRYAGIRSTPNGFRNVRVTVFAMPFATFIPVIPFGNGCLIRVPIDDESCWQWNFATHAPAGIPGRENVRAGLRQQVPNGTIQRAQFPENDYLLDREKQRTVSFTGIDGVAPQDMAVTESMGGVIDRTREHLGSTDGAIIRMRRMLIKAAMELQQGLEPAGLDAAYPYHLIRAPEKIIGAAEDWRSLGTMDDPLFAQSLQTPLVSA